jgi:hypothetical protein
MILNVLVKNQELRRKERLSNILEEIKIKIKGMKLN